MAAPTVMMVEAMMDGGHGTSGLPPCNAVTQGMAAWNSLLNLWYRCLNGFWLPL